MKNIESRIELLKAMHTVMMSMNNENAYYHWVTVAIPDEPQEDDFRDIAEDDQSYGEVIDSFEHTIKAWIKDGICK